MYIMVTSVNTPCKAWLGTSQVQVNVDSGKYQSLSVNTANIWGSVLVYIYIALMCIERQGTKLESINKQL
jgi:hypothetical protein